MGKQIITQEMLKEYFNYDTDTGIFIRLKSIRKQLVGIKAGYVDPRGYISFNFKGKLHYAHRLAWIYVYGTIDNEVIDHINGDRSDNRLINLRQASQLQNTVNCGIRANNSSGYAGVSFSKVAKKWEARYTHNKIQNYLGLFDSAELANEAYINAVKPIRGEFFKHNYKIC